jgi:hypothetical protein
MDLIMFSGKLTYRTTYEDINSAYGGSLELAFSEGNYAFVAQFGKQSPELYACSLIMLGLAEKGLSILSMHSIDTVRSRCYENFATWCIGKENESPKEVEDQESVSEKPLQELTRRLSILRRRGQINVLLVNKELELPEDKQISEFNIVTIGYSSIDDIHIVPGENALSIREKLDLINFTPDFILVFRPEYLLLFEGLQDFSCPKIAFCSDYDLHIYQKYNDYLKFDKLIVYSSIDHFEISKVYKRDTYTHLFSTLLDTRPLESKKRINERSFDVQISGSSFRTFFADKSILLYELTQLEDNYNVCIHNGFFSPTEYIQILENTKLIPTFVRFYGCYPTRGIEALVHGAGVFYPDGGVIEQFLDKDTDGIFPYSSESIRDDIKKAIKELDATEQVMLKEEVYNTIKYENSFYVFLKFCAFISLFKNKQTNINKGDFNRPYSVVGNQWLHGGIGQSLKYNEHIKNFLHIINYDLTLKPSKHSYNSIASTYIYLWQTLDENFTASSKQYRLQLISLAIETLKDGIKAFPEHLVLRFNLARLCYHLGSKDRAREIFSYILDPLIPLQFDYLQDDVWSPLFFYEDHFPYRAYIDKIIVAERDGIIFDGASSVLTSASAYYLAMLCHDECNYEETVFLAKKALQLFDFNTPAKFLLSRVLMQNPVTELSLESRLVGASLFEECVREYSKYLHDGILDYVEVLRQDGRNEQIREALKAWFRFFKRVRVNSEVLPLDRYFLDRLASFKDLLSEELALVVDQLMKFYKDELIENNTILLEEIILKSVYDPGVVEKLIEAINKKRLVIKNGEIYRIMGIVLIRKKNYLSASRYLFRYATYLKDNFDTHNKAITHILCEIGAEILKAVPFLYRFARDLRQYFSRLKFSDFRL